MKASKGHFQLGIKKKTSKGRVSVGKRNGGHIFLNQGGKNEFVARHAWARRETNVKANWNEGDHEFSSKVQRPAKRVWV